jgi:hypothetical protein
MDSNNATHIALHRNSPHKGTSGYKAFQTSDPFPAIPISEISHPTLKTPQIRQRSIKTKLSGK